jgi:hypothetical protein
VIPLTAASHVGTPTDAATSLKRGLQAELNASSESAAANDQQAWERAVRREAPTLAQLATGHRPGCEHSTRSGAHQDSGLGSLSRAAENLTLALGFRRAFAAATDTPAELWAKVVRAATSDVDLTSLAANANADARRVAATIVGTIALPPTTFDSSAQLAFARLTSVSRSRELLLPNADAGMMQA